MRGNPEKLDVDMEGRLARIVLSLRFVKIYLVVMIFSLILQLELGELGELGDIFLTTLFLISSL